MIVLQAYNVSHSYQQGKDRVHILDDLSLSVMANESIAIVGASGSGKSTLLHILGGLDDPSTGEVSVCERPFIAASAKARGDIRNQHLGFVYQFHHLLAEFSALENVMMPLLIRKVSHKDAASQAQTMLDKVGVGKRGAHKPAELSGGERQRVAIARAMVTKPNCILADEPTGNLDQETASNIITLLFELQQSEKTALVIVTHDKTIADKMQKQYRLIDKKLVLC